MTIGETRQTTIILMRHGEAAQNTTNLRAGHIDTPLTQKGQEQSLTRGKQLRRDNFVISATYTSELKRAKQTAEKIAQGGNYTFPIIPVRGLQEIYFGDKAEREGFSIPEFEDSILPSINRQAMNALSETQLRNFHLADGTESQEQTIQRGLGVLRRIASKHPGETILIVSHSGVNRSILVGANIASRESLPSGSWENTGYAVLQTNDRGLTFTLQDKEGIHFLPHNPEKDQTDAYLLFYMRRSR